MRAKSKKEAFKKYHSEVKTANDAFINGLIPYDEWYEWMKKLIGELENTLLNIL